MAEKKKENIVAIIDIGSNELRLRIAERSKRGIGFIESLQYPLNLAKDTFNKGKISYDKVNKVCEILLGFLKVCEDYGVSFIKAIATTAIREAVNRPYILDQIKIKTGLDIRLIDDNTEKLYIFKMMSYIMNEELKDSTMMSYTGSGSVGVAFWENGSIPIIQNIRAGSLRLSEMFEALSEYSSEYYLVFEEFLSDYMSSMENKAPENIKNFIASGIELPMIAKLCESGKDENFFHIEREKFLKFYDEIKFKPFERIAKDYGIPHDKAYILLAEMSIYKSLINFTDAKEILVPNIFLAEALAFESLYSDELSKIDKEFNKNTLMSAERIAEQYGSSEAHYSLVSKFCMEIFDKMKKIHGLGKKDKLLLQTAAIVHDCGKYVNMQDHHIHSYHLIKGSEIAGLSKDEIDIVANIALYHSRNVPNMEDDNYKGLKESKKVLVSKLAAVLRLADAMDRSKMQKFTDISVRIEGNELIVNASTDKNCELEQWAFEDKGVFFEEVFGMRPVMRIRKVI